MSNMRDLYTELHETEMRNDNPLDSEFVVQQNNMITKANDIASLQNIIKKNEQEKYKVSNFEEKKYAHKYFKEDDYEEDKEEMSYYSKKKSVKSKSSNSNSNKSKQSKKSEKSNYKKKSVKSSSSSKITINNKNFFGPVNSN